MIPLPSRPVSFADGVTFQFPMDLCCNCGSAGSLHKLAQDTRLTRYLGYGGSEYTFKLPLSFCGRCVLSASRRPPNLLHKLLVLALAFFGVFGIFIVVGSRGSAASLT